MKVTVLEGEGAFNDMKARIGHAPVVEVRDESNEVVSGAEVEFALPAIGAGGTFSDGQRTMKALTNARGIATPGSFRPNLTEGRFNITVTARSQGKQGTLVVNQSNTLAGSAAKSSKKIWVIVAVVAGAGAGAAFALSGHSGSSSASASPPTSISIGGVTVGGPK